MDKHKRVVARVAHLVRDHLQQHALSRDEQLLNTLQPARRRAREFDALCRKLQASRQRGWNGASARLARQMDRAVAELKKALCGLPDALTAKPAAPLPSAGDIAGELEQIADEFGDWRFDPQPAQLTATTDAIELEGVDLGRFELRLQLAKLADPAPYSAIDVVALDPNPAAGGSHVTHPHVADDSICLGNAAAPLRGALEAGRLADAFLIIRFTVMTYNEASAYVTLDGWGQGACDECDQSADAGDMISCNKCESMVCEECWQDCVVCDERLCPGCIETCPHCNEPVCSDCTGTCTGCDRQHCEGCLEDGLCTACQQETDSNEEAPATDVPAADAGAPGKESRHEIQPVAVAAS